MGSWGRRRTFPGFAEFIAQFRLERPSATPTAPGGGGRDPKRDFKRAVTAAGTVEDRRTEWMWERREKNAALDVLTIAAEWGDALRRWPAEDTQLADWHEALYGLSEQPLDASR